VIQEIMDVYCNSLTRNYDIDISVDEWKEILCLPEIQNDVNIMSALEKWYMAPDNTASCKSLAELYGLHHNFFSVQNKRLGKFVAEHLNRFRLIGSNGKVTYWGIALIELKKEKGLYIVQLRQELVDAIKSLNYFSHDSDDALNQYLQKHDLRQEKRFEFLHEKHEKPALSKRTTKSYPRDPIASKRALCHAEFKCEFDTSHETFPRRIDGLPYLEAHHLISMEYAGYFDVSIDVPENIVCLCSTCHNCIHYGQNNEQMIEYLWSLRKDDLYKIGININLSELLSFYLR
jgi:5-methylcytosine-specific restriction protein A